MAHAHGDWPTRFAASKKRTTARALAAIAALVLAAGAPGLQARAQEEPGATPTAGQRGPTQASLVGRWTGYTYWGTRYDTYWDINADGTISFGTNPRADGYHGTWEASGSRFTAYIEGSTYRGTISGDVISGPAERGGTRGSFRITRAGGAGTVAGAPSGWTVQRVIDEQGAWFRRVGSPTAEPREFRGYFMMARLGGNTVVGPGAIVRGDDWDGTSNPFFYIVHGRSSFTQRDGLAITMSGLTFLGTTWDPRWIALSDAFAARAGAQNLRIYSTSCPYEQDCRSVAAP